MTESEMLFEKKKKKLFFSSSEAHVALRRSGHGLKVDVKKTVLVILAAFRVV